MGFVGGLCRVPLPSLSTMLRVSKGLSDKTCFQGQCDNVVVNYLNLTVRWGNEH